MEWYSVFLLLKLGLYKFHLRIIFLERTVKMFDINNKKRINCHLEGRSPRQDLISKCKDCNNEIEQKAYRASAKRDLYARSPNGSRLKMTTSASCREAHKRRFLFNLIRRSLEKFFKKNFRDDSSSCFGFAKVLVLAFLFALITTAESRAETCTVSGVSISCVNGIEK